CDISCSARKYHGALAGFGVCEGSARPSSGALKANAIHTNTTASTSIATTARNNTSGKVWRVSSSTAFTCAEVRRVIKTTRRGAFLALESTPVTKSLESLIAPPCPPEQPGHEVWPARSDARTVRHPCEFARSGLR